MTSSIPRTSLISGDHLQSTAQSSWESGKAERRAGTTGRVCTKSPRELSRTARRRFEREIDTLVPFQLVATNFSKPRSKSLFQIASPRPEFKYRSRRWRRQCSNFPRSRSLAAGDKRWNLPRLSCLCAILPAGPLCCRCRTFRPGRETKGRSSSSHLRLFGQNS